MQDDLILELPEIVSRFRTGGEVVSVEPWGSGHIHDTFVSRVETGFGTVRYIHQRINHGIFPSPENVMENITRVTEHIRGKISRAGDDPERRTLTVVPLSEGGNLYRSPAGDYWRTFLFIENAGTYDLPQGQGHARSVAAAFARFQEMLSDLPGPPLHETIPHFRDTRRRFRSLLEAIEADRLDRAAGTQPEIEFALKREHLAGTLEDLLAARTVPERIVHHDTKINNVLIDDRTGEGICVIDLDTVMPGTTLYDFGNAVRMGAARAAEDERDLSLVGLDTDLFEALVEGYLSEGRRFLTTAEIDHLTGAPRITTFMVGVRFLADHLAGDTYFRIHREGHNLDRCRTQFRMVNDMEEKAERLRAIVERYR